MEAVSHIIDPSSELMGLPSCWKACPQTAFRVVLPFLRWNETPHSGSHPYPGNMLPVTWMDVDAKSVAFSVWIGLVCKGHSSSRALGEAQFLLSLPSLALSFPYQCWSEKFSSLKWLLYPNLHLRVRFLKNPRASQCSEILNNSPVSG